MSTRTVRWPAGVPCGADLTVPDLDAAIAFYGAVLTWEFQDTGDEFGGYRIAEVGAAAAAGIGPQQVGAPNVWTLYFASDDVDATAASIADHGGTVLLAPGDVGGLGRMCIAADPTGAAFGVWQAGDHIGAGIVNEPGGLTWDDLRSPDPDTARAFYAAVFGHRMEPLPDAGPDYATFARPEEKVPLGGIGGMLGAEGAPPHWIVYFGVADTLAAMSAAEQHGGPVLQQDLDTPYGRMASIADPAGAAFMVIETDGSDQPDRSG